MTGRRNVRRYHCPACGALLAHVKPEMVFLRRLVIHFDNAPKQETTGDEITLTCRCGHVYTIHWPRIQP